MFDFLRILIRFFEQNNISYMLSGSVAMSIYTLPRFTRDFDFVVNLNNEAKKKLNIPVTEFQKIDRGSRGILIRRNKKLKTSSFGTMYD